jgi:type IV pilus assembly protein PilP
MRLRHWIGLMLAATLSACGGGDTQDLQDYIAKVRQRESAPIEQLPEIKQVATYVYDPGDRRDPFIMDVRGEDLATPAPSGSIAPDPLRRKEELEQYTLDSLKMVGTLAQADATWALILAPGGILHKVRVGNYLGHNNGQIMRIDEGQVQVTEIINEGGGEWRERQASVALKQ